PPHMPTARLPTYTVPPHVAKQPRALGIHDLLTLHLRLPQDVALPVLPPQDADRLGASAERREAGVGRDDLDRPHAVGADVERRIGAERRRDAEAACFADHRLLSECHAELD